MWPTAFMILSGALLTLLLLWVWGLRRQARRLSQANKVPPWAAFWGIDEYRAFNEAVQLALAERELEAVAADGVVAVALPDGRPMQLGLQNLAQRCAQHPRRAWGGLVEEHLDTLLGAEAEASALEGADFDAVRDKLMVRLYPAEVLEESEADAVELMRPAPGLVAVLVYDLPHTVSTVPAGDVEAWDKEPEELLDLALENLRREPDPDRRDLEVERGVVLRVHSGESFFVSSLLLQLDRLLPTKRPYGALVCAPTRHLLLVHLIRDSRVLLAINALIPRAYTAYQNGPGSLAPDLFWWRDGTLTHLPTAVESDKVRFNPPAAFVTGVMEPLAEDR